MAFLNFGSNQEHRVFNYKPMYYDPEKDELKRRFGAVDGTLEKEAKEGKGAADKKEGEEYVPGSYLHGAFRDGNFETRKGPGKAQAIVGLIGLLLFVGVMIYITKFYSLL